MRFRTFIVEDEPPATDRLRGLLSTENEFELVGESTGNADTVAALRAAKPDVVFLDLHVPAGDGFSLLESAKLEPAPAVVVVTAHGQYAVEAFDRRATDYLLKPFRVSRLQTALGRVREEFARRNLLNEGETTVARDFAPASGSATNFQLPTSPSRFVFIAACAARTTGSRTGSTVPPSGLAGSTTTSGVTPRPSSRTPPGPS